MEIRDLIKCRGLLSHATPGAWHVAEVSEEYGGVVAASNGDWITAGVTGNAQLGGSAEANTNLIAAAPRLMWELVMEVDRLRDENAALKAERDRLAKLVGDPVVFPTMW